MAGFKIALGQKCFMSQNPYDARSFQMLVENIEDYAIFFLDPKGKVSTWNKGAQRLKGYAANEIIGHSFSKFYSEEDIKAGKPQRQLEGARSDGRIEDEGWRIRKDGSRFWANVVVTAIHDDRDKLIGFAKITRDMTERKLNEEHLLLAKTAMEKAKDAAVSANEAKTQFLANMSHEIRTPLNGIIGMAELLKSTPLSSHQRDLLDTIRFSGDNLLAVLNDVLDYSKIENDKLELDFHAFNLLDLIDEVVGLFYYRALEKNLDLNYQIDPDLPLDYVGDGMRIRQIMINLVSNALKFTDVGEVRINIEKGPGKPSSTNIIALTISVQDSGIGIPPDRLDRLFVAFSQVDASTARRFGGTGLGLAICERMLKLMGGSIRVDSQQGAGSTFSFELSLRRAEASSTLSAERTLFLGKRVLIVDDIETNRNILKLILNRWGIKTVEAANSEQALEVLGQNQSYDAGLIDYHMPMANGLSLARKIKQLNPSGPLPLILISSYTGKYAESELREVGYVASIAKPLRQTILRSTLQDIFLPESGRRLASFSVDDSVLFERDVSILVAEDNPVNIKVVLQMLKRFGLTADTVSDGVEAIKAQALKPYDLILMDVHMPNLDGLQATAEIRKAFPLGGRPRIVALTADTTATERGLCLAAGMDGVMTKPVKLAELHEAIEKYTLE